MTLVSSTRRKRACSWGIAPRPKIGSRYTHLRWIGLSCARAPSRSESLVAYCWMVSAKPPKKGDSCSGLALGLGLGFGPGLGLGPRLGFGFG